MALAGARFDFKVEFAGLADPANVSVTLNGKDYAQVLGKAADFERIVKNLGADWESRAISFKPYPNAHVMHGVLDAALQILRERRLDPVPVGGERWKRLLGGSTFGHHSGRER